MTTPRFLPRKPSDGRDIKKFSFITGGLRRECALNYLALGWAAGLSWEEISSAGLIRSEADLIEAAKMFAALERDFLGS